MKQIVIWHFSIDQLGLIFIIAVIPTPLPTPPLVVVIVHILGATHRRVLILASKLAPVLIMLFLALLCT